MTLIHVAWQGMLRKKILAGVSPHNVTTIERMIDGTWKASGHSAKSIYDASNQDYHIIAQAGNEDTFSWAGSLKVWRYSMNGDWQVTNDTDPLVSNTYQYNAATKKWGRETYTSGTTWTFDSAAVSWTNDTTGDVWQYTAGTWHDITNDQTWSYSTATNVWTESSSSRTWQFATPSDQWEEIGGDGSALVMPPRPVVQYEMIWQMQHVIAAENIFNEYPQVTWQADEHDWHAVGTKNNAQARYNPRHTYEVSWRDTHTQNTVQYSMKDHNWIWRADNQHWHNAAAGLWGRDTRVPSSSWSYQSTGTPSWKDLNDVTYVWRQGETSNTWIESESGATWVYDPAQATWTMSGDSWGMDL